MRQCNLTDADQDDNGEVPEAGKGDRNSEEKEEDEEEEEEEDSNYKRRPTYPPACTRTRVHAHTNTPTRAHPHTRTRTHPTPTQDIVAACSPPNVGPIATRAPNLGVVEGVNSSDFSETFRQDHHVHVQGEEASRPAS